MRIFLFVLLIISTSFLNQVQASSVQGSIASILFDTTQVVVAVNGAIQSAIACNTSRTYTLILAPGTGWITTINLLTNAQNFGLQVSIVGTGNCSYRAGSETFAYSQVIGQGSSSTRSSAICTVATAQSDGSGLVNGGNCPSNCQYQENGVTSCKVVADSGSCGGGGAVYYNVHSNNYVTIGTGSCCKC